MDIYTDGACHGNPGPGSWAVIFINKNKEIQELSKSFVLTTNNRMELLAVIEALATISETEQNATDLFSDSLYVINAINKGWLNKWEKEHFCQRPNTDLWKKLLLELKRLENTVINFHWVQGHTNNEWNNYVDALTQTTIRQEQFNNDKGYTNA